MLEPFNITQENSLSPVLLVADHASQHIPDDYNALGIEDPALLRRHVAWDIGIEDVTRRMSEKLQATALYATFSRLLVDANRYPDDPALTPAVSDGVHVPANVDISEAERLERLERFFNPYHAKIRSILEGMRKRHPVPLVFSMHSFTPVMEGYERPWHVGILWDRDERLAIPMMDILRQNPTLVVGDNEPYSARKPFGYTMNEHGTKLHIPHVVVEIRQDLIDTHHGAEYWANLMTDVVSQLVKRLAETRLE